MERRSVLLSCTRAIASIERASWRLVAPAAPASPASPAWRRPLQTTWARALASRAPKSRDRGPKSDETTQTDFAALDVLRNTAAPATAIDACMPQGFALSNNMKLQGSGVLLVGGEAFRWRPWRREGRALEGVDADMTGRILNAAGQYDVPDEAWGVLDLVWPKPDLLIIGTGPRTLQLSPAVRGHLNDLGIRLEVSDTGNAAAQFNMLATERGTVQVAAALVPIGWKEAA